MAFVCAPVASSPKVRPLTVRTPPTLEIPHVRAVQGGVRDRGFLRLDRTPLKLCAIVFPRARTIPSWNPSEFHGFAVLQFGIRTELQSLFDPFCLKYLTPISSARAIVTDTYYPLRPEGPREKNLK